VRIFELTLVELNSANENKADKGKLVFKRTILQVLSQRHLRHLSDHCFLVALTCISIYTPSFGADLRRGLLPSIQGPALQNLQKEELMNLASDEHQDIEIRLRSIASLSDRNCLNKFRHNPNKYIKGIAYLRLLLTEPWVKEHVGEPITTVKYKKVYREYFGDVLIYGETIDVSVSGGKLEKELAYAWTSDFPYLTSREANGQLIPANFYVSQIGDDILKQVLSNISQEKILQIVKGQMPRVRLASAWGFDSIDLQIVLEDKDQADTDVAFDAQLKVKDPKLSNFIASYLVFNSKDAWVKKGIVPYMKDRNLLLKVRTQDKDHDVRQAAKDRLDELNKKGDF